VWPVVRVFAGGELRPVTALAHFGAVIGVTVGELPSGVVLVDAEAGRRWPRW